VEPPKTSGSGKRSGVDTSVTYNRRQTKAAAEKATNVSVEDDKLDNNGTTSRSTAGRGSRTSAGNTRQQRRPAASSTPTVETVKRKISSEWDDCMHVFVTLLLLL